MLKPQPSLAVIPGTHSAAFQPPIGSAGVKRLQETSLPTHLDILHLEKTASDRFIRVLTEEHFEAMTIAGKQPFVMPNQLKPEVKALAAQLLSPAYFVDSQKNDIQDSQAQAEPDEFLLVLLAAEEIATHRHDENSWFCLLTHIELAMPFMPNQAKILLFQSLVKNTPQPNGHSNSTLGQTFRKTLIDLLISFEHVSDTQFIIPEEVGRVLASQLHNLNQVTDSQQQLEQVYLTHILFSRLSDDQKVEVTAELALYLMHTDQDGDVFTVDGPEQISYSIMANWLKRIELEDLFIKATEQLSIHATRVRHILNFIEKNDHHIPHSILSTVAGTLTKLLVHQDIRTRAMTRNIVIELLQKLHADSRQRILEELMREMSGLDVEQRKERLAFVQRLIDESIIEPEEALAGLFLASANFSKGDGQNYFNLLITNLWKKTAKTPEVARKIYEKIKEESIDVHVAFFSFFSDNLTSLVPTEPWEAFFQFIALECDLKVIPDKPLLSELIFETQAVLSLQKLRANYLTYDLFNEALSDDVRRARLEESAALTWKHLSVLPQFFRQRLLDAMMDSWVGRNDYAGRYLSALLMGLTVDVKSLDEMCFADDFRFYLNELHKPQVTTLNVPKNYDVQINEPHKRAQNLKVTKLQMPTTTSEAKEHIHLLMEVVTWDSSETILKKIIERYNFLLERGAAQSEVDELFGNNHILAQAYPLLTGDMAAEDSRTKWKEILQNRSNLSDIESTFNKFIQKSLLKTVDERVLEISKNFGDDPAALINKLDEYLMTNKLIINAETFYFICSVIPYQVNWGHKDSLGRLTEVIHEQTGKTSWPKKDFVYLDLSLLTRALEKTRCSQSEKGNWQKNAWAIIISAVAKCKDWNTYQVEFKVAAKSALENLYKQAMK